MTNRNEWILTWIDAECIREYSLNLEAGRLISRWLSVLNEAGIEYVIGGAFAVHAYTGIWRDTKDIDIFLQPNDLKKALDHLSSAYFNPDIRDTSWLAKVHSSPYTLDLIFGFRNGQMKIDHNWFRNSHPVTMMGIDTRIIAIEELIASKTFIAFRDRFDGADIVHLLRASGGKIDWQRLMMWMSEYPQVLLWHLLLFLFVYPGHSDYIPDAVMKELSVYCSKTNNANPKAFRGMLLDPYSFEVDCREFGYEDLRPASPLVDYRGEPL
jgi:predicted nucleotidyltransferase